MHNNEIMETVQSNKKDKDNRTVSPLHERKRESRGQSFRRHMCAAAAILLISMVGSGAMQYIEPSTILAKESFAGIGKIVDQHIDSDEPYKILDIVPADVIYSPDTDSTQPGKTYTFTVSTLGYLVDGQAPLTEDLETIFTDPGNTEFYSYEMREKLFDSVIADSGLNLTYQEAYPGVDFQSAPAGWTQIFYGRTVEGKPFSGRAIPKPADYFGDGTGYDYNLLTGNSLGGSSLDIGAAEGIYVHDSKGAYRVSFAPMDSSEDRAGGYVIAYEIELDAAPETSLVYRLGDDGLYHSNGDTVGDLVGNDYDISGGGEENEPEDPNVSGNVKSPELQVDPEISAEPKEEEEGPEEEKGEEENSEEEKEEEENSEEEKEEEENSEEKEKVSENIFSDGWRMLVEEREEDGPKDKDAILRNVLGENYQDYYKALVFEYVSDPSTDQLYWPESAVEIGITKDSGIPYPFDAYNYSRGALEPEGNTGSQTVSYVYMGPGLGEYKLERDDNSPDLIMPEGAPVYFRCTIDNEIGNDWLKQYVFGSLDGQDNENNNFQIEVKTVRADQVKDNDVQEADLIFLESGNKNVILNTGGMTMNYIVDSYPDMSADAVDWILKRAVVNLTPVIVDYDIVESEDYYKDSKYQYLAKALLEQFPDKEENNHHYVNQNIYVVGKTIPLVSGDFAEEFDSNTGFTDVIAAIKAENTTLSEDDRISEYVSKARAVQYIVNFSVGVIGDFKDLRILEIQPSANRDSDLHHEDEGRKLTWKTKSMTTAKQILSSVEAFDLQTVTKSVVEFNGEWEDINGIYDIVFIGLDGQCLNQNDDGGTIYNNEDLDGKVYHRGDSSGVGENKFDENDLTGQKMDALLDYMAAGYPVLVENDCFEEGSAQNADEGDVNHAYIEKGSNMDLFLKAAVSDDRYKNCIFTVSDAMAYSTFMTQVRISKPRVSTVDENDEETAVIQRLVLDENNEYHGQIRYKISDSHDEAYVGNTVVRMYVDYNYDGHYASEEEVTEFLNADGVLDVQIDGMGPGILPWKLEVSDVDNEYRRDSVQGYFELVSSVRNEMKVLQITDKKDDPAVDLQYMFHKQNDSMLAHYLQGAESYLNTEMQFETVTVDQIQTRLRENEKYLEQWDVVVLTLNDADLSDIMDAVSQYVDDGRSLLVCGQNIDGRMGGLHGALGLLGQTDRMTFTYLGCLGENGADIYQRYRGLNDSMFGAQSGLKAEKVNDGIISFYPYSIENNFTFGQKLKASPYLLDLENNRKTEADSASFVTAWYTLGSDSIGGSAYGISPKDARNSYYCYSKGNVVYLAQSEYPYIYSAQDLSSVDGEGADESRFFVNALFAAYTAGFHNAHVNIVSGFSPDAADIQTITVPFDEVWLEMETDDPTMGILDNTVDVYFKFIDNNFATQKTTLVGFCYEDSYGSEQFYVDGKLVTAEPFSSDVWTVKGNRLAQVAVDEELQPGRTYRIEAPVKPLRSNANLSNGQANKADIYVVLKTSFTRNGRSYDMISADSVSLNRARLFQLE